MLIGYFCHFQLTDFFDAHGAVMMFCCSRKIFLVVVPRWIGVNDAIFFYILDRFNHLSCHKTDSGSISAAADLLPLPCFARYLSL